MQYLHRIHFLVALFVGLLHFSGRVFVGSLHFSGRVLQVGDIISYLCARNMC